MVVFLYLSGSIINDFPYLKGEELNNLRKTLSAMGIALVVVVPVLFGLSVRQNSIRFIDDVDDKPEQEKNEPSAGEPMNLHYSKEYQTWKNTTDTTFRSLYNGNRKTDILAQRPYMVVLWAGYAFSKDYASPRGHMYAIDDLYMSLRTGAPSGKSHGSQPASCWMCKSPDVPRLLTTRGAQSFYKKKWAELGSEIVNPIGCADCHEPESMSLRISRPFLTEAYGRRGMRIEEATEQEMRSLVCAQCHSEYYFRGENHSVTLPWDCGLTADDMETYYDSINFCDFTHKLSRTPILKAQHPDFELAQAGIHAQRGISCGECHMPVIGEERMRYNNHHIQSPLAMIDRTCQTCHRESEETLRNNVYERQNKVLNMRNRLEEELAKAHIEAKFAWEKGAAEVQMRAILKLIRQAQWRWDFGVTSHGAAFHAPQEVMRILGDGLDKATQARMLLVRLLARLGYTQEVPMPDLSTKEKAQRYIGLDMEDAKREKDKFLKTVVPEWLKEAKANERIIDSE